MTQLSMQISGMSCGHCVHAVKRALAAIPGVEVDDVSIGSATVHFDENAVQVDRLKQAVEDEGFAVT